MKIEIKYADVIDRVKMLCSFEGREQKDDKGESMYNRVKIAESDEPLIRVYIQQGAEVLESQMTSVFEVEGDYSAEDKITWELHDDSGRRGTGGGKAFVKSATEAIVAYAMMRWLENKIAATSTSYANMFKDLAEAVNRIIKTKRKPQRPTL